MPATFTTLAPSWCPRRFAVALMLAGVAIAHDAGAQSLGTFHWQLAPYCNVITVQVTQVGASYTLDGYDTQCGGSTRAPATGMAVLNPSGSIELGLAIVTSPGATPVHVSTTIDLGSLGGAWRDSAGNSGTLVFTPSGVATGSPRPLPSTLPAGSVTSAMVADGTLGVVDVNTTEIQQRVSGSCQAGELMTAVNVDGTVACQAVTSTSGGDITGVGAGAGLTGGGATGNVTLSANFGGDGSGNTVAYSNHEHAPASGSDTVALGIGALALNTSGGDNVGVGTGALGANTSGTRNVAVGSGALAASVAGDFSTAVGFEALGRVAISSGSNTAVGNQALGNLVDGHSNAAFGSATLFANVSGEENTGIGYLALRDATGSNNAAIGYGALRTLTGGNLNIGVGHGAGGALTNGSNNIYIGSLGASVESDTIRIGRSLQTRTFLAGVHGVDPPGPGQRYVVIDSNGQLGTEQIAIAVSRDTRDANGSPSTVSPLLAEVQRLEREREAMTARIDQLETALRSLMTRLR